MWRRLVVVLSTLGLSAGGMVVAVVVAGPSSAGTAWTIEKFSAAVTVDRVVVSYKLNPQTTRPETLKCTLNGAPVGCGKASDRRKRSIQYRWYRGGFDYGQYTYQVSVKRDSGRLVTRSTTFSIGTCQTTNTRTGVSYSGDGANLQTAIDAAAPGDTLNLRGTCVGTFTIGFDLTLAGPGRQARLDADAAFRVVTVTDSAVVILENLSIGGGDADIGGGIYNGGGTLTLRDSSVVGNAATSGSGGGIYNEGGTVTLQNSGVNSNASSGGGGGIYNDGGTVTLQDRSSVRNNGGTGGGGGLYNTGTVMLQDQSEVTDNSANRGGGISNTGTVTMQGESSVTDNSGGGIYNTGTFTMQGESSVAGNSTGEGGGIYNDGGTVTLQDQSAVTDNYAGRGGGIYNTGTETLPGTVTLKDQSSVTGNRANLIPDTFSGGGVFNAGGFRFPLLGRLYACNDVGANEWTGAIKLNYPDDAPSPSRITCT